MYSSAVRAVGARKPVRPPGEIAPEGFRPRRKRGRLQVDRPRDRRSWAILAQDFFEEASVFWPRTKKTPPRRSHRGAGRASASLRSENCRVRSAVEMTPRGKRG